MKLRRATAEEAWSRDRLAHPHWAPAVPLDVWLAEEQRRKSSAWARNLTCWVGAGEDGEILASCETYESEGRAGDRTGTVYSIASVFTEPHLRGKGHATRLMRELGDELRARPGALA